MRHACQTFVVARIVARVVARVLAGAAVAVAAQVVVAPAADAQSIASGTRRYRVDAKTAQDVDASVIGGGRQKTIIDRSAYLRVTLSDSAGGKAMRVVIDSIVSRGTDQPPNAAATADSARGKQFAGHLAADGTASQFSYPDDGGTLAVVVGGLLDEFIPRVKAGAKAGDSWTVSGARPMRIPNGELTVTRRTSYEAMGAATHDGVAGERVNLTFTTTSVGKQQLGPVPSKVDGNSSGSGSMYVSTAGVFLGGVRSERTERRLLLEGAPAPMLVMAESVTTITLLK